MLNQSHTSRWISAVMLVAGAVLLLSATAVLASPPMEPFNQLPTLPPLETPTPIPPTLPPLPTLPPGPTETPAPPGPGNGGTGFLAILEGYVWENGDTFKPLPDVKVRYTSDGVSIDVMTDKNGYFRFVNIGPDDGVLDLAEAKWQSGTGGVIIKPPLGRTIRANLAALAAGKSFDSKVVLASSLSSPNAAAGQTVTFTFKVTNGTSGIIAGLMLGDQLPDGLTVSGVTTSRGDVLMSGPSLVVVDLNTLAAGDSATVNIVALAKKDLASGQGSNRATLLYREGPSIAAKSAVGLVGGPSTLPVTGIGVPVAAILALAVVLLAARRLRMRTAA